MFDATLIEQARTFLSYAYRQGPCGGMTSHRLLMDRFQLQGDEAAAVLVAIGKMGKVKS